MKKIVLIGITMLCSLSFAMAQTTPNVEISNGNVNINTTGIGKAYYNTKEVATRINASLSEQDTGIKWIDGKTIYQKTWSVNLTNNNSMYFCTDLCPGTGGFLAVVPELTCILSNGVVNTMLFGDYVSLTSGLIFTYYGAGAADMTMLTNYTGYTATGYITLWYTKQN